MSEDSAQSGPVGSTELPAAWRADAAELAGFTPAVLDRRGFPADGVGSANLGLSSFVADGGRVGRVRALATAADGGLVLGIEWADGTTAVRSAAGLVSLTAWRPAEPARADSDDAADGF
jgi:hypothetical protein